LDQQSYNRAAESATEESDSGRDFARMLNTVYTPGAALADLVTPETIVCRCEEVRASEVDAALKRGAITLNDVKRQTRCGMGYCQGRICGQVLTPYLQQKAGINPEDAGQFNARAPVKPVPLGALANMPDPDLVPGD
jgi:NAD(P)H-nitrite reductase large subunit